MQSPKDDIVRWNWVSLFSHGETKISYIMIKSHSHKMAMNVQRCNSINWPKKQPTAPAYKGSWVWNIYAGYNAESWCSQVLEKNMSELAYFTANCVFHQTSIHREEQGRISIFVINAVCSVTPVLLNIKLFLSSSFKLEKSIFRNVSYVQNSWLFIN